MKIKTEQIVYNIKNILMHFSDLKYIKILQESFLNISPVMLVASIILIISELPIITDESILIEVYKFSDLLFNYIALLVVISISFHTYCYNNNSVSNYTDTNCIMSIMVSVLSFILLHDTELFLVEDIYINFLNIEYMGVNGIFAAMVITIINTEIFKKLNLYFEKKIIAENWSNAILGSFLSIIPTFIILSFWWIIRNIINFDIFNFVIYIITPLIQMSDNVFSAVLIPIINRILWFIGIHGGSMIESILSPILTTMDITNLQSINETGQFCYIISGNFFSQYVWIGFFPLAILCIATKTKRLKEIGFLSLLPTLFNIDEPLLFGIPIILNPILIIPFVFSYVLFAALSFFMINFGIIPNPYLYVPWTIPAPIKAYIGTGNDIRAFLWVLILWVLLALIFYPFLKKYEKSIRRV